MFGLLTLLFFTYHFSLIIHNETTIEHLDIQYFLLHGKLREGSGMIVNFNPLEISKTMQRRLLNVYDLNRRENIEQVFGRTLVSWLFPISSTKGNGMNFKIRTEV